MGKLKTRIQTLFGDDSVQEPKKKKSVSRSTVLSCARCPLNGRKQVIDPINKTATVLVIGEAPGKEEEEQGLRFVGKSGRMLRDCLEQAGFRVDRDIHFENACRCRPTKPDGGNRTPDGKEISTCYELYLSKEIERFQNIILVGKIPELSILGKTKAALRGNVFSFKGKRIAATYHPAYVLRMKHPTPEIEEHFISDLKFFHNVFMEGYEPKYTLIDIDDNKAKDKCLQDITDSQDVIFDIETTGLSLDSIITVVGVGSDTGTYVIPISGKYAGNKDFVRKLFSFTDKTYVGYNVQFDYNVMMANGLCDRGLKLADAMIIEHLLDMEKDREDFKLKTAAVNSGFRWSRLVINPASPDKFEDLFPYNAEDTINTRRLYRLKRKVCSERALNYVADTVIFPSINVIAEMERNGILIDTDEMKRVRVKLLAQIDILDTELTERFGERNWSSTAQMQELLSTWLGNSTARRTTETGQICTDEEALKAYLDYAATIDSGDFKFFCETVLQLREFKKMLNTYIDGMADKIFADGTLKGSFSLIGTATGRLSSSRPNLQNIPRDGRIKSMFIAEPGWTLVEADASQIELRVVASVAPEPVMIKAYNLGEDLHSLTASLLCDVPLDKVTKLQRQTAKAVNFGLIYGQSWEGFKNYAKTKFGVVLTDLEAQQFRKSFFDKYFGIKMWHSSVETQIMRGNLDVVTVFGRIRRLSGDNFGHKVRQALNTPIQSPASDCNLLAMRYVWDNLPSDRCKAILTVHDQFMFSVRDDYVMEAAGIIRKAGDYVSKQCRWLKVPFVLDIKVGKNWGVMKDLKK